ncbi:MAG: hypothetical protein M3403_08210, partial [Gemmatimonadota bacterium]|nr:hypothetical protein [Gemmatimonadota bacterium]
MRHRATALVITAAVIVLSSSLEGQTLADQKLATYRFNVSVPVRECTFVGVLSGSEINTPVGAQFIYIDTVSAAGAEVDPAPPLVVIQFLEWKGDTAKRTLFNTDTRGHSLGGRKTFCVAKAIFDRTTERTYATRWTSRDLAAGVLILPIKMRLSGEDHNFSFSKDVSIGTVAGTRWRLSKTRDVFLSFPLIGAGIAAVTLDSASTHGKVRESIDRAAVT